MQPPKNTKKSFNKDINNKSRLKSSLPWNQKLLMYDVKKVKFNAFLCVDHHKR